MEVHQLEILRELGALGSVKAVADTLMVTPSAVSQQLAHLQRSVEVPLTRKEGRNLVLTEAGQVLADAGAAVVSAMAEARGALRTYHGSPAGRVTVSGFHSAGQALFAPLARMLDRPEHPRIELSDEDVAQQDFPALTARYDLVLAHRMDHSPRWPAERVAVIPLAHEPLDVALPAGHPLAQKDTVTADDVGAEAWVTSHPGYSPADVLAAVAAVSSREPNIVHRINDYSTVAALVATGGVVGLLPRYTAGPVLNPDIVLRPLAGISTRRRIDLLARPENLKRRAVVMVCEALEDIMAGLVRQG
ncbi:LysR family transcriptional regulator [Arthrobacter sp. FW306-05-C]|uniref:LysR family transcriptional regulator n=1 Tax=Arthrobacter TaxID=1663 RepID=UPI001EF03EE2|nr:MULTISPECIES: LysR family transcriptional regulator [Arthrobacter]MDP9987813.1 DNA-binding transcriptional LysR family regulator [Arthrobacter oryzae]UKA68009.1 LysR family transcriptional regulator [Arthrobacter sp. FW306-05-C]UKA72539.1 LysR family transcriptional regulator [Arthrobacter sp. FW306-06-A]UKA76769.1 LysR family transcriptional regulator [Arthrobacter sp. FW306-07-I]